MPINLPFRQIHLDFHTGPAISQIGSQFDADTFGDMLVEARVNSVTLFAKCHHGHLYYDTKNPARHPGLKPGFDLLGEELEACRKRGIRAPIYLSVQCDEYVANTYPGWRVVDPEGRLVGSPLGAGWHIVDMSSPYEDFLAEQISEVMKKYKPVDEIFLDMCWDQVSCSTYALEAMTKMGLDPTLDADRNTYARRITHRYMAKYNKLVADLSRGKIVPVWYNSRPKLCLPAEQKFLHHIEIEALPTGFWGYMYFPLNIRFARNFNLPYIGMTGRFHKSWADFGGLKPEAALFYECSQMLAHGAGCSVGDQMHPRGTLDRAAYQLIGKVYEHVEACEPWCIGAKSVTQIAVLRSLDGGYAVPPGDTDEGIVRALQQLGHQFDFLPFDDGVSFAGYDVVVITDKIRMNKLLADKLRKFVKQGGGVLIEAAGVVDADGKVAMPELGIKCDGPSPFTTTYLRFGREIGEPRGAEQTDHVMYDRGLRIRPAAGGKALARIVEPYFERAWNHFSSHFQTPADKLSPYAAAVRKGRFITLAIPMFRAYANHANISYRHLIGRCIDQLLPAPLTKVTGPAHVEVTLTQQSKPAKRTIAHVLSFVPHRRAVGMDIVEDAWPLTDLPLSVKLAKKPGKVTQQPEGIALACDYADGYASVLVSTKTGHAMVVFE
jgi:hypothetical protein